MAGTRGEDLEARGPGQRAKITVSSECREVVCVKKKRINFFPRAALLAFSPRALQLPTSELLGQAFLVSRHIKNDGGAPLVLHSRNKSSEPRITPRSSSQESRRQKIRQFSHRQTRWFLGRASSTRWRHGRAQFLPLTHTRPCSCRPRRAEAVKGGDSLLVCSLASLVPWNVTIAVSLVVNQIKSPLVMSRKFEPSPRSLRERIT